MVTPPISCLYACLLFKPELATLPQLLVIQSCLQEFIGPSPTVLLEPFSNWQKVVTYDHVFVTRPKSAEEIQRTVLAAVTCGVQVSAVGSAHTADQVWGGRGHVHIRTSELTLEGGKRVILLPKIAANNVPTVKVAAGVTQAELKHELAEHGYVFHPGPLIGEVTIGGAIATASHNGFYHEPSIGGYMTGGKLVDGRGDIREFSESSDADVLKALRCNLGMLGILFEIEMTVIQQVQVNVQTAFTPLRNLFSPAFIRDLVPENYFVNMFYAPYNSLTEEEARAVLRTGRVPKSWDSRNDLVLIWVMNPTTIKMNFEDERPSSVPDVTVVSLSQDVFKDELSFPVSVVQNLTQAAHVSIDGVPEVTNMEYTIADPNFTTGSAALRALSSLLNRASYLKGIQPMQEALFRWFKGADCLLCTESETGGHREHGKAGEFGHYASFHIHNRPTTTSELMRFHAFETTLVTEWDKLGQYGRPHWGKELHVFPALKERLRSSYGDNLDKFKAVQRELDPSGVFTNVFLRELFDITKQ
ncbi:uncharacterized protein LOC106170365 [Lingula anatina]|uniref:Uncharacterized protein LOC106170365 n=1 Tax=Lingula anatina TaxID=7574 RepID=A0A1S3J748_LINAN|nr:uncharacterized protein LOC106170365 [Lingula anatina]|eukprot:XP_013405664.1 uncharacterized protein LOC106170365 [Lingula anatina]